MIVVGIDVASKKHDYMIQSSNGSTFSKRSITIPNSVEGIKKLHNDITAFCGVMNDSMVRIGLESTGIYSLNILLKLIEYGYDVMVINPSLIDSTKKSIDVAPAKNDNLDSIAICRFLLIQFSSFKPYTIKEYHTLALKSLSRERFRLVLEKNKTKQSIDRLITILFPEYKGLFSNYYQGSALKILEKYPSAHKIKSAHDNSLSSLIHGKCSTSVLEIKEKAKNSIGIKSEYYEFELQTYIKKLRYQEEIIDEYESKIKEYVDLTYHNILSIPGISYITAGLIIGEVGNIDNFSDSNKLYKFSGLAQKVHESGNHKANRTKPTKKGSKYLRYALFQSANIIWQHDKTFSDYYHKKINEHKHYYVVLGHIEKKLVRLIYSLMKSRKEYTPQS